MASLDRRLNPLYAIKECSSCGIFDTLKTVDFKGSLEDKILVPLPDLSQRPFKIEKIYLDCGDPVHGLYYRQCALIRKTLEEVFQDFQDTSKSSNDSNDILNTSESSNHNTNVVSAPREPFVVKQDPGVNSSQSPLQINHNCCFECGDSLDGIFCQRCTCNSCGNGAHIGYNCPPKALIIFNPEQCTQTIYELPQTLPDTYDSKPNSADDFPNVFNPPPQPPMYSCEFCGNNAHYGHYCTPQVLFIYPEPCYNQDFNFPQDFHDFQQQYLCCENCGGPHETFQCQPMNEGYYYEQNSCYDLNSFGFDQFQPLQYTLNHPILNVQNEFLNSQNKLMEQMTSICDMIPICYDDDEDYTIAITPVLSTKELVDSLIMEDEHLDTILATKSDEVIKSSVENLVPIPSEFKGISEDTCDVPVCEDPSTFDALSNHSEILSDSNNDGTSSDDDSYENIEYIEASPLNLEIDSLEEVNEDQEEKEFDLEDIFQIQDVILREKLLKISHLVTNIESLKDNPTPDRVLKSTFSFPIPIMDSESFFKESDNFLSHLDNSLPEFKTFSDHTEETRSGSTTTHANNSLPEYDSFLFEVEPDQEGLTGIVISDNSNNPLLELSEFESFHFDLDPSFPRPPPEPPNVEISLIIETDARVINNFDELNEDECFDPRGDEINVEDDDSFIFVIRTFLPFLTYPEVSPLLLSTRSEDTIFNPGTDIAKISRKRLKPDKHGHGNGIECARAGRMISKVNKSQPMVNSGQP
ncbi:hypothetical protein Tco_1186124 [Tanacetum coccineum]